MDYCHSGFCDFRKKRRKRPSYSQPLLGLNTYLRQKKLTYALYKQYLNFLLESYDKIYISDVFIDIVP